MAKQFGNKYRKRVNEVEAAQVPNLTNSGEREAFERWLSAVASYSHYWFTPSHVLKIRHQDGVVREARQHDYVVRHPSGYYERISREIFEQTYDEVTS